MFELGFGILNFAPIVLALIALHRLSRVDLKLSKMKAEVDRLAAILEISTPSTRPNELSNIADVPLKNQEQNSTELESIPTENVARKVDSPASAEENTSVTQKPNMEEKLASRWFVWIGGAAIGLGGLLFVKYAHDVGLIPPLLRAVLGWLTAIVLVLFSEWVRKSRPALAASYVPAAISAAGLLIGFGVTFAAYSLYGILSPGLCFPILVAIGLMALWLSRRQGQLIAALGLLGSFSAPVFVPSDNPSAFGFFAYLTVIVVSALWELRNRNWWWLGYAAISGGLVWALLWLNGGMDEQPTVFAAAIFALVMGTCASFVPRGQGILAEETGNLSEPGSVTQPLWIAIAGSAAGSVVLGYLVHSQRYGFETLLFLFAGMLALTAFGWVKRGMTVAPVAAALFTFAILMSWPEVAEHILVFDDRGFWTTIPGSIVPALFRNWMLFALVVFGSVGVTGLYRKPKSEAWALLVAFAAVFFFTGVWARADQLYSWQVWCFGGMMLSVGLLYLGFVKSDALDERLFSSANVLFGGSVGLALFAADRAFDNVYFTISVSGLILFYAYASRYVHASLTGQVVSLLATFVAVRLFAGREFWSAESSSFAAKHWPIYGYGIPVLAMWSASLVLPQATNRRWRIALEGIALGLLISLISLEIRILIGGDVVQHGLSFLELSAHATTWMGAAFGLAYRQQRAPSIVAKWGAIVLLAMAFCALILNLTVLNPVIGGKALAGGVIFNALSLGYLVPCVLVALIAPKLEDLGLGVLRNVFGILALALFTTFITLSVKRWFQGPYMIAHFSGEAESYVTSLVWLISAVAAFVFGLWFNRQSVRYGALALMVLTVLKVFLLDLSNLDGLWRIASLVGLGICLVGIGWAYTRFEGLARQSRASKPVTSS